MALNAERAKYGLPAEFKVTREMKKSFTPQEKVMYKCAYEVGGAGRANEVMRVYFAKKKAATARGAAGEASGASGAADPKPPEATPVPKAAPPTTPAAPVELTVVPPGETLPAGQLLYAGTIDWESVGKKTSDPESCLWSFHRLLVDVKVRLVASGTSACHSVCVDEQGQLYAWGRNDAGQLGLGDSISRAVPTKVDSLSQCVRHASCGRRHTVVCTEDGEMFSWGSHKAGQLGTGSKPNDGSSTPQKVAPLGDGSPVMRVAAGAEFSMAVNSAGQVGAWGEWEFTGHPMYGQLGNGTNGEFIERAGSVSYHFETAPIVVQFKDASPKLVDVACGNNHTVVMSEEGQLFSWGFGGYGRLGLNNQNDSMTPALVDMFNTQRNPRSAAKMICAGATCTYGLTRAGQTFFWGRTKTSGEATMYPKPVYDLNGWEVRSLSCGNNSTFVVADDEVITWGPSPTYGELGYGDPSNNPKSSTVPKIVDSLTGVKAFMAAGGHGFGMVIADAESDEKAMLKGIPVFEPAEELDANIKAKGTLSTRDDASGSSKRARRA